jgi:IstB-like ATP binding protein
MLNQQTIEKLYTMRMRGMADAFAQQLARAFGQKACRDGFTAYFATAAQLFRELELGRADGSYAKKLRALAQVDVLIVDDWAMAPLAEAERRAFLEICDERYLTRSTLLTSQLPIAKWLPRSEMPRWRTASWIGWCMALTGSSYRAIPSGS